MEKLRVPGFRPDEQIFFFGGVSGAGTRAGCRSRVIFLEKAVMLSVLFVSEQLVDADVLRRMEDVALNHRIAFFQLGNDALGFHPLVARTKVVFSKYTR